MHSHKSLIRSALVQSVGNTANAESFLLGENNSFLLVAFFNLAKKDRVRREREMTKFEQDYN